MKSSTCSCFLVLTAHICCGLRLVTPENQVGSSLHEDIFTRVHTLARESQETIKFDDVLLNATIEQVLSRRYPVRQSSHNRSDCVNCLCSRCLEMYPNIHNCYQNCGSKKHSSSSQSHSLMEDSSSTEVRSLTNKMVRDQMFALTLEEANVDKTILRLRELYKDQTTQSLTHVIANHISELVNLWSEDSSQEIAYQRILANMSDSNWIFSQTIWEIQKGDCTLPYQGYPGTLCKVETTWCPKSLVTGDDCWISCSVMDAACRLVALLLPNHGQLAKVPYCSNVIWNFAEPLDCDTSHSKNTVYLGTEKACYGDGKGKCCQAGVDDCPSEVPVYDQCRWEKGKPIPNQKFKDAVTEYVKTTLSSKPSGSPAWKQAKAFPDMKQCGR